MSGSKHTYKDKERRKKKSRSFFILLVLIICLAFLVIGLLYTNSNVIKRVTALIPEQKAGWDAVLYFGDDQSDFLINELRRLPAVHTSEEKGNALMQELIRGPSMRGVRTLPGQTTVRWVNMNADSVMIINLGPELLQFHPGGSTAELLAVYSIVNTITANIPEVKSVQLVFNGKKIETIAGHIDCSNPIYPDKSLIH